MSLTVLQDILPVWLVVINVIAFAAMAADKHAARHRHWRTRESTLFVLGLLGGAAGAWLGMYCFRHKTKHRSYVWGMPLILAAQVAAGCWFYAAVR